VGTYAVTGSASGMGGAVAARLRAHGHTVIGVDIQPADDWPSSVPARRLVPDLLTFKRFTPF
jgi:nucleoside-diphosphate-sugar epimerase